MLPRLRRSLSTPLPPTEPPKPTRPVHLRVTSHIESHSTSFTVDGRPFIRTHDRKIYVIEPGEDVMPITPPMSRDGSGRTTPRVEEVKNFEGMGLMEKVEMVTNQEGKGLSLESGAKNWTVYICGIWLLFAIWYFFSRSRQ